MDSLVRAMQTTGPCWIHRKYPRVWSWTEFSPRSRAAVTVQLRGGHFSRYHARRIEDRQLTFSQPIMASVHGARRIRVGHVDSGSVSYLGRGKTCEQGGERSK